MALISGFIWIDGIFHPRRTVIKMTEAMIVLGYFRDQSIIFDTFQSFFSEYVFGEYLEKIG